MNNKHKTGRNQSSILSRIPEPLKHQLQETSCLSFECIGKRGMKETILTTLVAKISEFVESYNFAKKDVSNFRPLLDIKKDNLDRALFTKNPAGFTRATAETLTRFAYSEKIGWDDFIGAYLKRHPEENETFIFPNEATSKSAISTTDSGGEVLERTYLLNKIASCTNIFLPFAKEQTLISIDDISIPTIKCEETLLDHVTLATKNIEKKENRYHINIEEEVELGQQILIVGEGGIGKSTLSKVLFTRYAKKILNAEDVIFPILVELGKPGTIESLLQMDSLAEAAIQKMQRLYIPLFIFDGIDERDIITTSIEIQAILNKLDDCRVIVTSRANKDLSKLLAEGFRVYELEVDTKALPKLLLKSEDKSLRFERYLASLEFPKEIQDNNLLYTSFILHYSNYGEWTNGLTRGSVLKRTIEDNFLRYWELAKELNRNDLPSEYSICNVLSLLAVINRYPALFLNAKTNLYLLKGKVVRNDCGINKSCLLIICKLCIDEQYDENFLIGFLVKSTIVARTKTDLFIFNNKVIEDYFLCRGAKVLLENKPFDALTKENNLIADFTRTIFQDSNLRTLASGILEHPDESLLLFINQIKQLKSPRQSNIDTLFFISTLINIRGKEIVESTKNQAVELLLQCSYEHSVFLKFNSETSRASVIHALLLTESELAFDYLYDYFINHYKELNFDANPFWDYFVLNPQRLDELQDFDFRENLFKEFPLIVTKVYVTYLHQYHALEMLERYVLQYFACYSYFTLKLPHVKLNEAYLNNEHVDEVCSSSLATFWRQLKNEKLDARSKEYIQWLMETFVKEYGKENPYKMIKSFSSATFYNCHEESILEEFLERILFVIVQDKTTRELDLNFESLTRTITINRHFTKYHKIISAIATINSEANLNAYKMWRRVKNVKHLLTPFVIKQFRKDISGDDIIELKRGLAFFRTIPEEISENDRLILMKLVRHDDAGIRELALHNLTNVELPNALLDELLYYIFDSNVYNTEYLLEKSIALSCLFSKSKYHSAIAFECNIFEPLLMMEIETKRELYMRLKSGSKEDFMKSITIGFEYRFYLQALLKIASNYSLHFLIGLRGFTYKYDDSLYTELTDAIYATRARSKRISLYIQRDPTFTRQLERLKEKMNIPSVARIRMLAESGIRV
jgi:hypothetical protein